MDRRRFPRGFAAGALLLAAAASGCAGGRMYAWGDYDETLYAHYRSPQDHERHLERLRAIVVEAEAKGGGTVPPGLYAEYGYALFEAGRRDEAVSYFRKEEAKWPESAVIMEKMIRNVQRQAAASGPVPSAAPPAPEGAGAKP